MAKVRQIPLRPFPDAPLPTVDAVVADLQPTDPLFCLRPAVIAAAAQRFTGCFPGDVLYAVKCNPEPRVLGALWAGGVRHFDCASIAEVRLVRKLLPAAEVHFMHPVKARPAIGEAFDRWDVTHFALDSADELAKILQETVPVGLVGDPPALGLFVRLALPKGRAVCDLSGKFGAPPGEAAGLLRAAAGRLRPAWRLISCRLAMPRSCRLRIGVGACRRGDRSRRGPGRHRRSRRRLSG
jgi:ornithine decarboxylase